jgi:hypothetical protein
MFRTEKQGTEFRRCTKSIQDLCVISYLCLYRKYAQQLFLGTTTFSLLFIKKKICYKNL